MSGAQPIPLIWDGQHFVPPGRFAAICAKQFVKGEAYMMAEHQERSSISHRQYFAAVNRAWENLPENIAKRYPSPDHLRKVALIRAGFANHQETVADSPEAAERISAFVRKLDDYAVVKVTDCVVSVWTAKSQDNASMDRRQFQKSKDAVIDQIAGLLGVTADQLLQNTKEAA